MVRKILAGLIVIASIIIVISFFLPWARVSVSVAGVSKQLTESSHLPDRVAQRLKQITYTMKTFGDPEVKMTVSGYKIPGMVNNKTTRVAISLAEIMTKSATNLEQKSYLVYLFPLLGILCGVLAVNGSRSKARIVVMLLIAGIVGITGFYNLSTADMTGMAVNIDILNGLWDTIYAFLFIFLAGIVWLIIGKKA